MTLVALCVPSLQSHTMLSTPDVTAAKAGIHYISKTLKYFIFLNLLKKKKKGAKCNNFQRNF